MIIILLTPYGKGGILDFHSKLQTKNEVSLGKGD